jgi:predicted HAD superfamily Cof-like phosphohydrolase
MKLTRKISISLSVAKIAIDALKYKAANDAGHSQSPNLFKKEDTRDWKAAEEMQREMLASNRKENQMSEDSPILWKDIYEFHKKFGIPMAPRPMMLDDHAMEFRLGFMEEELTELNEAKEEKDLAKMADALADLVYVAIGTALMMGIPWDLIWSEVQRANMTKERAPSDGSSKRKSSLDVIKPLGWTGPNHEEALQLTGRKLEIFCTSCGSTGFKQSNKFPNRCTFCDGTEKESES